MSRSVSVPYNAVAVAYQNVLTFEDDEDSGNFAWEDFIADSKAIAKNNFPSFYDCDKWLGNEDHAILENRFAYFGVSEYCGLASIWIILKDMDDFPQLAENWADSIQSKFDTIFGNLRKVGTFSNGEAVYEKK
jgi:hypothetical protein